MERKRTLTLDDVLEQFNLYQNDREEDSAWTLIQHKREVFSDLLIQAINPESQDVREWDDVRWRALVSFADDFNNFCVWKSTIDKNEPVHRKTLGWKPDSEITDHLYQGL